MSGQSTGSDNTSLMQIVGVLLIPFLVIKIISVFPRVLHKKSQLGKKGDCGVIAHRGSRQEGDIRKLNIRHRYQ